MNIISVIISIVMLYVLYYIFDNYDITMGLLVNCIYGAVIVTINNGFNITYILISVVVSAIETFILGKIYSSSISFGNFFVKVLLVGVIIAIILVILSSIIGFSLIGSNGILGH